MKSKPVKAKVGEKTLKDFPRCNALINDRTLSRCRKHSAITQRGIYAPLNRSIKGLHIEINLCIEHALAFGYDFTESQRQERIVRESEKDPRVGY